MAPRPVRMKNLATPLGNMEFLVKARQASGFASEAYRAAGQAGQLVISLRREGEEVLEAYPDR